jgi:hypothetical protein
MDLDNLPVVGGLASVAAALGDLAFYGGELFVSLILYAVMEPSTWLSIVLYLQQLAGRVAWLPSGPLEQLVVLGLVAVVTVSVLRFLRGWWRDRA